MTKELTRFEIAAVKRIAANTKTLRGKVEKLNAKIAELTTMKATYLNEIAMWESPIVDKYGYTVDQILDGSYLIPSCDEELPESISIEEELDVEAFESYANPSTIEVE
jgi:uncharacterized protein YkvS